MTEREAQQLLQLAHAAIKTQHHDSALGLVSRVIAMEAELPSPTEFDGQRHHRLVATAVAMAVDAQVALGQGERALEMARRYWVEDPVDPYVAGALVRALVSAAGAVGALDAFKLVERRRASAPDDDPSVPVCMTICRNEMQQLPSFLEHHRRIGVRRFIVVDNGSTDGTLEHALGQPDVDVWTSDLSFRALAFGANAFTAIAHLELRGRWLLLLDADERFVPPQAGENLRSIVAALDADGLEALAGTLLDVYDEQPLLASRGPVPLDLEGQVFFDRVWSHTAYSDAGPFANGTHLAGGVRCRVFGSSPVFLLSKVPLVKFTSGRLLVGGQHDSNTPSRLRSQHHAGLLHTKFLGATDRLDVQATRGEFANAASDYVSYTNTLTSMPNLTLYDPAMSIRYEGADQLLALGIAR